MCCVDFSCSGTPRCGFFSNWTFNNANLSNTTDCTLYVLANTSFGTVFLSVYKDIGMGSLVAYGEGEVGIIELAEQNGSGLSGTVFYTGDNFGESVFTLSCS